MTTCERFEREFLPSWEQGALLPADHMHSCADCRARYARYTQLAAALRSASAPELSGDWQQRVLDRVRALDGSRPPQLTVLPAPPIVHGPGVRLRRSVALALPFALAAAAVLLVVSRIVHESALPVYAAQLEGGEKSLRGSSPARAFRPGARFQLLLRPEHAVRGEVAARVFIAGPAPKELEPELIALPKGVLRLSAITPQPPSASQHQVTLVVVVGRPRALGSARSPASVASVRAEQGPDWRRVEVQLDLTPDE